MESKYSVGIERNIILEGEVKSGEQEREALRIETQRLRDELSDLKVEAEIRQDKLRHAEAANERSRLRKPTPVGASIPRPKSSISEHSPSTTTASSPTIATPPTKSVSSTASDTPTPPSPPTSDRSILLAKTPAQSNTKLRSSLTNSVTPRPAHFSARPTPRHSRGPSVPVPNGLATPASRRTTQTRTDGSALPNSASLTQIRGLIGKMQKLEQRVQSVRSKLPAPTHTPPRASPRPGSALSTSYISGNITVRSSRKRTSGNASTTSSVAASNHIEPLDLNTRTATRQSFGLPPPTPTRDLNTGVSGSRPGSRASLHSRPSISNLPSAANASRPSSRQSMSGARTPLGHYPSNSERIPRPRSSIGGNFSSAHGHSSSVHRLSGYGLEHSPDTSEVTTPTPARRTTLSKEGMSSIPMPSPARRQSATGTGNTNRRVSSGTVGDMAPPERKKKLSGVGETY